MQKEIENLYRVFSTYKATLAGSSPLTPLDEITRTKLLQTPLKQLGENDLDTYLLKALTTWGDLNDFKYFLPRLIETLTKDSETVYLKIAYGKWREWPEAEKKSLTDYFKQFFIWSLNQSAIGQNKYDFEQTLILLSIVEENISPYFDIWKYYGDTREESAGLFSALEHLNNFIYENRNSILTTKRLSHSFWKKYPEQEMQIVNWLLNKSTYERFFSRWEDRQYSQAIGLDADWLEKTYTTLKSLLPIS